MLTLENQYLSKSFSILLFSVLLCIGLLQIVSTYSMFSHTWDEPAHLAAGMQYLDLGIYEYELQHPPLARLATAVGPYMAGLRSYGESNMWQEGSRLLYENGDYQRNLTLARLGIIPFFILLFIITWIWSAHTFGTMAAAFAGLMIVSQPAIIAHASLATTDLPLVVMLMWSLYLFTGWLQSPTILRATALGLVAGLTTQTKLSALPFLVLACLTSWFLIHYPRLSGPNRREQPGTKLILQLPIVALCLFLSAWAVYGFGWTDKPPLHDVSAQALSLEFNIPIVISNTASGILEVLEHNKYGHRSYLFGEIHNKGSWMYFPVALAVKATLPVLFLALFGFFFAITQGQRYGTWVYASPGLMALVILLFSMSANINIGVRHILIVFPLLIIQASFAVKILLTTKKFSSLNRMLVFLLMLWQCSASFSAHPDYLAWFNGLAGKKPENILLTADLDWGQDLNRLGAELQSRNVPYLALAYNGFARLDQHNLPVNFRLEPDKPVTGWIAVSLWSLEAEKGYHWLKRQSPQSRIGRSIELYYIEATDLPEDIREAAVSREKRFARATLNQSQDGEKE